MVSTFGSTINMVFKSLIQLKMTNTKTTITKQQKVEDLFFQIFDSNPIGIIISDLETTKIRYVNKLFLQIFGYTKTELIGKTANQLNFFDNETIENVLLLLKQKGFAKDIELLARKKNGETFWILASVKVITTNNEKLSVTSFTNIEVQKKAQAELVIANKELKYQNSEKEKRAAELVIANEELKYQNNEKEKRATELVIANEELKYQNSEKEKRATELVIANEELKYQNSEKEKRAAELVIANEELLKSENYIKKLNEDLEHKVAERTAQLELINKNVSDYKFALDESSIVAITDKKGMITHVNSNFCKISKYKKDELIGKNHRIVNSGYHSKQFFQDMWAVISNGNVWRGEIKNIAKDGITYWVNTTIVPFLDAEGKPYKYLAIRSDITHQMQSKEELEVKIKERTLNLTESLLREKELNEIKTRFVSFVSHEFRTPLASILSSSSLIEMYNKPEQSELRVKHIARISNSVVNLTNILNDFLTHGELEQGSTDIKNSVFNLPEFITTVSEELNGALNEKNQRITCFHNGMLMIEQSVKILRNILFNLLTNASKYSDNGKEIIITSSVVNNKVLIHIKDHGIGIPEKDQSKLYDQFFRASNAEFIQGTGLGLSIVKKYIELIKGKLEFTSKENEGTTFSIEFNQHIKH
jgi:PAS domain S-box-containing protein